MLKLRIINIRIIILEEKVEVTTIKTSIRRLLKQAHQDNLDRLTPWIMINRNEKKS